MRTGWTGHLAALALLVAAPAARATETQWWTTNQPGDYARAEARGVVVRADGALELGPRTERFADDSLQTVWAVAVLPDGAVALAGDHGRIDRWTAREGVRPWVKLAGGQVLCLAVDGDGLLAGTGPDGLVYRIGARGDTIRLARTGERYVWALAPAGRGVWYAATGTRGRLLKLEAGRPRIVLDTEESNLVSLVADGAGGVFAGGDSKGRVYHALADGSTRTVFDAGEDEVRALARDAAGTLWAGALSGAAIAEEPAADEEARPAPAKAPVSGGHATLYRLAPDSAAVTWWAAPQPLLYALALTPQGLVAGTGNRAGVYRVERAGAAAQLLAAPEGQVTALATGADGSTWAATSNPAALWRLGPGAAAHGELSSDALDAHAFARFGRLRWEGAGGPRFATRSGNAAPPDTTWTPWRDLGADGRVESPPGRYLQWRVTLGSAAERVDEVSVAYREQNLPPRVDEIGVAPQGQNFRDGEMTQRAEAVTQTLPGGQKVEYSATLPASKPTRELPVWARGLRTLQWRASDPNGDPLRYRLQVRSEAGGEWIEIGKDLEASVYTWNTNTLPDGRYRVRVIASDAPGNAVGEERTAEATSEPFTVDNTPPEIGALAATGEPGAARLEGEAHDALGPLVRLEVAVDDGTWRLLAPDGGVADAARLAFHARLTDLAPGDHLVSVRAVDAAGNAATRAVRVSVPRAR
ncbi:MAG TPA: hypothetical protein VGU27_07430 [Candidatus Eisenbacteria bacterium]|nr:hypothetical protein [Candidatus Eisenbacteria bacterium]